MQGFRSYLNPTQISFRKPITVLIGRNNSGKSNFLEFLRWVQSKSRGLDLRPLGEYFHSAEPIKHFSGSIIIELNDDDRSQLLKELPFSGDSARETTQHSKFLREFKLSFAANEAGVSSNAFEVSDVTNGWARVYRWTTQVPGQWRITNFGLEQALRSYQSNRPNVGESGANEQTIIAGTDALLNWGTGAVENTFRNSFSRLLDRWFWISPQRRPNATYPPTQNYRVNPSGDNLAQVMNTVQSDSPDQFNELSSEFQAIIPSLGRVSAPLRGNQATIRFQEEGRVDVTLANTSDGVLQATGIAGALLTFPANSLVLIEEPEIHLHAAAQRQLFSLMKRLTEKKGHQFLVTTHSTVFSQSSEMVETYLITKNEGNSALRQIAADESLQLIKHDLGHENTDLFGFNAVVIAEGDCEQIALPMLAQSQAINFHELGVKIYNVRGSGRSTRVEHLLGFLKDSDTIVYLILDSHDTIREKVDDWIRAGLMNGKNVRIWDQSFEDLFYDRTILEAIQRYAKDEGVSFEVDPKSLSDARDHAVPVARIIARKLYEQSGHGLKKPLFAEFLAEVAVERKEIPFQIQETLRAIGNSVSFS